MRQVLVWAILPLTTYQSFMFGGRTYAPTCMKNISMLQNSELAVYMQKMEEVCVHMYIHILLCIYITMYMYILL